MGQPVPTEGLTKSQEQTQPHAISIMNLCIRAKGTTVACANIKMYPINKI